MMFIVFTSCGSDKDEFDKHFARILIQKKIEQQLKSAEFGSWSSIDFINLSNSEEIKFSFKNHLYCKNALSMKVTKFYYAIVSKDKSTQDLKLNKLKIGETPY